MFTYILRFLKKPNLYFHILEAQVYQNDDFLYHKFQTFQIDFEGSLTLFYMGGGLFCPSFFSNAYKNFGEQLWKRS